MHSSSFDFFEGTIQFFNLLCYPHISYLNICCFGSSNSMNGLRNWLRIGTKVTRHLCVHHLDQSKHLIELSNLLLPLYSIPSIRGVWIHGMDEKFENLPLLFFSIQFLFMVLINDMHLCMKYVEFDKNSSI